MTQRSEWTQPDEIRRRIQTFWDSGRLLRAGLIREQMFPLRIALRRPGGAEIGPRFSEVREWIQAIEGSSRSDCRPGYTIEWEETNNRGLGRNRLPAAVVFENESDALEAIGARGDASQFHVLASETFKRLPALRPWVERRPMLVVQHADDWLRILAVLDWFRCHPRPNIYLRQLDIEGVDTKFVESRKGLFTELLNLVLPADAIDPRAHGAADFEHRFGVRCKPALMRLRILDTAYRTRFGGLSDLTIPVADFSALRLAARFVFITENEINGLVFPEIPDSIVVFGLGFGVASLAEAVWLRETQTCYWGDIDTHGFAILAQLRQHFPEMQSLLMDRDTLMAHRSLWGYEREPDHRIGTLRHLWPAERELYEDLQSNRLGDSVRLEQERVSFSWMQKALGLVIANA